MQSKKRKIVGKGIVVEARALHLVLREGTSAAEVTYPLRMNGLEAMPGQHVTVFDDGKFHIGTLPHDWK